MIVRDILKHSDQVVPKFDWHNDFKDTYCWLRSLPQTTAIRIITQYLVDHAPIDFLSRLDIQDTKIDDK